MNHEMYIMYNVHIYKKKNFFSLCLNASLNDSQFSLKWII